MTLYCQGRCFPFGVFLFKIFLWLIQFCLQCEETLCKSLYFPVSQYHLYFHCLFLFHNSIVFLLILFLNTSFYLFFLYYECVVTSLKPSSCHHVMVLNKMYDIVVYVLCVCNDNSSGAAVFLILSLFSKCRFQ